MTLDALRADLRLLGPVAAHPVERWRAWRTLAVELFGAGGATIDTPPAQEDEPILARTVIQPDGDVLVFVDEDRATDAELLGAHTRQVGEWYQRSHATVRQAVVVVRTLALAFGGGVAAACGWVTGDLVNRAVGAMVFGALLPLGGWACGLVASALLRHRIDGMLRGLGVEG